MGVTNKIRIREFRKFLDQNLELPWENQTATGFYSIHRQPSHQHTERSSSQQQLRASTFGIKYQTEIEIEALECPESSRVAYLCSKRSIERGVECLFLLWEEICRFDLQFCGRGTSPSSSVDNVARSRRQQQQMKEGFSIEWLKNCRRGTKSIACH